MWFNDVGVFSRPNDAGVNDTGLSITDDDFKSLGGQFRGASGNLALVNAVHLAFLCQIDDAAFPGTFKFFLHVCKVGIPVVVFVHFIGNDFVAKGLLAVKEVDCPAMLVRVPISIEVLNQGTDAFAALCHQRCSFLDDVKMLSVPSHHAFEPYVPEVRQCGTQCGFKSLVVVVGIRLGLRFQGCKFFFQTCKVAFFETLVLGVVVDIIASVRDFETTWNPIVLN